MPELKGRKLRLCLKQGKGFFTPFLSVFRDGSWNEAADGREMVVIEENGLKTAGIIEKAEMRGRTLFFSGGTAGRNRKWTFTGEINLKRKKTEYMECGFSLTYLGEGEVSAGVKITLDVIDSGVPRWMVPAMFYKDNRPEDCIRLYPRYSFTGGDHRKFVSDRWSFCSDRCSFPAVFCWTDRYTTCLAAPERFSKGLSGVAFQGNEKGVRLTLNFPYEEGPVKYNTWNTDPTAERMRVQKGEKVELKFYIYAAGRDLHAYDLFLRDMYEDACRKNSLLPWMSKQTAGELLSFGLYSWHYDDRHHALYETCSFDAYFAKKIDGKPTYVDRPHMHVSWTGGAPYAYSLMWYAVEHEKADYYRAAVNVLDKIGTGLAPCGTFWPEWTLEHGWGTGWNPDPNWVHGRTVSEASLFMLKAVKYEELRGIKHRNWADAVKSNLDFAVNRQAGDGGYGTYYDVHDGTVKEWRGAGGILWIPALLAGAGYFKNKAYLKSALRAGLYYARFLDDEYIYGAPEDVHLTPTSEDGYNAVIAYLALYEETGEGRWLDYARKAADWTMTFRWTYNAEFAEDTILGKYDFRTRGGDMASVSNNHIHNYGLVCHPELLRLWEYTGDDYYLERARDHLFCFHQFIARHDGDFNARRGMVSEQWYHNDWWQPKGSMLQLAHSWCAGLIIYADLYTHSYGDVIIDWRRKKVYLLEPAEMTGLKKAGGLRFNLKNIFPEDISLKVAVFQGGGKRLKVQVDKKGVPVKTVNQRHTFSFTLPGRTSGKKCALIIKEE